MRSNINKRAGITIEDTHYRLVQVRGDRPIQIEDGRAMEIWKRQEGGTYEYFGVAGPQKKIDLLSIDGKRELLRRRILEITAGIT
jgi:choline kinase